MSEDILLRTIIAWRCIRQLPIRCEILKSDWRIGGLRCAFEWDNWEVSGSSKLHNQIPGKSISMEINKTLQDIPNRRDLSVAFVIDPPSFRYRLVPFLYLTIKAGVGTSDGNWPLVKKNGQQSSVACPFVNCNVMIWVVPSLFAMVSFARRT